MAALVFLLFALNVFFVFMMCHDWRIVAICLQL